MATKVKVPEPKPFNGARSVKDLENFLWDMEQYFKVASVLDQEMITITSMYLSGDAKLWWRTHVEDDADAGRGKDDSWEALKKELKDKFLPTNTAWVVRDSLKKLKQTGTMREYVKTFSSLMLDMKNMLEDDKLFNFMFGLQPWAQLELKRQAVCDLPTVMSAADAFVDYKNVSPRTKAKTSRRKMARRTRISRRKIGVTRAKKRVLPLNKTKNNPS